MFLHWLIIQLKVKQGHGFPVNDVIADKNVVTKTMNNSTGLQRIELNGFAKRHWQTGYYPFAYGWCLGLC